MKNVRLALTLMTLILYSCGKKEPQAICMDTDALNNNKAGKCIYPKDSIMAMGVYNLRLTKYTLDPNQVGEEFYMEVRQPTGECPYLTGSLNKQVVLHWGGTSLLQPYFYCVSLDGFNFIAPDTVTYFTWAGAPISGVGRFANGGFRFDGIVHSSDGDSVMVIESY